MSIDDLGRVITLVWINGDTARFHAFWLLDNSLDPTTRSANNGQRLVVVNDIPADVRVVNATISPERLTLDFSNTLGGVIFNSDWLHRHRYDIAKVSTRARGWTRDEVSPWQATEMQGRIYLATMPQLLAGGIALRDWLAAIERDGVARVTDVPCHSGAVCQIVETFGFVRQTNYGRFFDVRATVNPTNLADTNLGLQAHSDNPYRDPVPTLQVLACLENSVTGGESTVIDGFAIVAELQRCDPQAFELLATIPARFEWSGAPDVHLASKRPMIELGSDGELLAVRFNSRSIAPLVDPTFDQMPAYYDAYRLFSSMVDDPRFAVTFRLAPGDAFIVDNTRVLHARSAFGGIGSRWLQGCYGDIDGVRSTLAAHRQDMNDPEKKEIDKIIEEIESKFTTFGDNAYLGESVTISAHMLQAAALAEVEGASPALVVAALLHDIGHFTGELGMYTTGDSFDRRHEVAGERYLRNHFLPEIADCVGLHVAAKRYLCAVDPAYHDSLSTASRHSLILQGGAMSVAECADFEQRPHSREAARLRRWDDAAKHAGVATKRVADYRDLMRDCLLKRT